MKIQHILFALLSSVLIWGCHSSASHTADHHHKELTLPVTTALKTDTSITEEYVCQMQAIQHIEIRALERGYLQTIYVDEGQYVKKGQLMFQIMPLIYRAEVQKAEAEADFARIEYLNTKSLADSNIVSKNELALAKAKYDKALAEVSYAKVHLSFTEIRAPFSGIMDRFHVRQGSLLEEGELMTVLSDNSEMWVYFNMPEAEYLDYMTSVKKNSEMKVQLRMANNQIFGQKGKLTAIEADFNNETGNIAFRATFPNPDGLLRHGETGNILINEPIVDALLIPQKATYEILDKKFVFVVDETGIVRSREITLGAEMPHLFQVTHGLGEKEHILLEGLRLVRENDKIHSQFSAPLEVIAGLDLYAE
ncbi:MAG: efflux RND transporter periplasmic adaptor subunit [Bacteroidetes bacterium]|nr:efflux RND transporter periplasmic adaptor subunit [Bacteroidota bacterium]